MSKYFQRFKQPIEHLTLPTKFDYPFYYEPHPLAKLASEQLKEYLNNQTDFEHNFGLNSEDKTTPIGKMFGILVCKNEQNQIGFIAAVSGKLANTNQHKYFVPPVFDMLNKDGFFLQEEERLNEINRIIERLEFDEKYIALKQEIIDYKETANQQISAYKQLLKQNKSERKKQRNEIVPTLNETEAIAYEDDLIKQSLRDKYEFRKLNQEIEQEINRLTDEINRFENEINDLKEERRTKSNALQNQLFNQYQFLNQFQTKKGLIEIC